MLIMVQIILSFFLANILLVCITRGLLRYRKIKKYSYAYYDSYPLGFIGKLYHNFYHQLFKLDTVYISFILTVFEIFIFVIEK